MSDESAPQQEPRQQLKSEPDNRPGQSSPAPPAPPSPLPDEPAGAASEKVRLKVRVPIQPPPAAPSTESTLPVEAPAAIAPSASEEKGETGTKLKLKPKTFLPPSSTPPAPVQPAVGIPGVLPPRPPSGRSSRRIHANGSPLRPGDRPPIGTDAKSGTTAPPLRASPPPAPPPPAPPQVPQPPLLTAVEAKPPTLRLGLVTLLLCGVVLIVFSGIGYRTYQKLTARAAKQVPQPVMQAKPTPPATKPGTPSAPAAPSTPQGRAIQKARDVVAAVAANRTAPANEVIGSERGPVSTGPNAAAPAAVVAPSQQFRVFVDRLKIGGVRVGPPARLFLGGVTYKPGDVVDQTLGIVFFSVDMTAQEIVFKDSTGAVVRRRY
jgi:hypothetical protein